MADPFDMPDGWIEIPFETLTSAQQRDVVQMYGDAAKIHPGKIVLVRWYRRPDGTTLRQQAICFPSTTA